MKRIPRPQGSTFLSLKYQELKTEEAKQVLISHLVNLYTLQGFRWNGKPTSIPELANILQIPSQTIMACISDFGTKMGSLTTPQNIESTLKSIITLSTSWAIEDRGKISLQLDQLLTSQDGRYKAFITSEVNKTLKLMLESNKNIMEAFKTFFTSTNHTTNILNYMSTEQEEKQDTYLNPEQALELIIQNALPTGQPDQPGIPSPSAQSPTANLADDLYQEYGLGDLKDVRERRTGTDALQALEPQQDPSSTAPGPTTNDRNSHKRRNIPVIEDADILPDS